MKVSIDVPDDVIAMANDFASRKGMDISEVFITAVLNMIEEEEEAEYCDMVIDRFITIGRARPLKDINRERDGIA